MIAQHSLNVLFRRAVRQQVYVRARDHSVTAMPARPARHDPLPDLSIGQAESRKTKTPLPLVNLFNLFLRRIWPGDTNVQLLLVCASRTTSSCL